MLGRLLLLAAFLAFSAADHEGRSKSCYIRDIPRQPNFDEHKYGGIWYNYKFYYSRESYVIPLFLDYIYDINTDWNGLMVTSHYSWPRGGNCTVWESGVRHRLGNAHYRYDKRAVPEYIDHTEKIIVETDYKRYAIQWDCLEQKGGNCVRPEVTVWVRKQSDKEYALQKVDYIINRLCVNRNIYRIIRHSPPPACIPPYNDKIRPYFLNYNPSKTGGSSKDGYKYPTKFPEYGYGYAGYGYPGYGYSGYGYPGYYGGYGYRGDYKYDKELYEKRKTFLMAETKTFDEATEKEQATQHRLNVEIELLKFKLEHHGHPY